MSSTVTIENFTAFYTSRPFWAGDAIDIGIARANPRLSEQMAQVVFAYDTNGLRLRICKDGKIMLHVPELEAQITDDDLSIENKVAWWGRYLDYLNCLYLLLDSAAIEVSQLAYFELSEITNKDAFRVRFEDGRWAGESIASESLASYYQMGRFASRFHVSPLYDPRIHLRTPLTKEVFDTLFASVLLATENTSLLKSLSSISKSIAEYKVGNYETSLMLSWFVCESKLSTHWRTFLDESNRDYPDGSTRISSSRRQTLTGRDYPLSVVSNMLELSGRVTYKAFERIDSVRRYRNKVVHQEPSFTCGPKHCQEAVKLALKLALQGSGIRVTPNLNYSVSS